MQENAAKGGMVVAPHYLASRAGRDVLKEGGNAIEAMVASAAAIAVAYPHMNALGGDGFWLIAEPGKAPVAIEACGRAAGLADRDFYAGLARIPARGPLAALTVGGTVDGWRKALEMARHWGGRLPLSRLLAPAEALAREGVAVTRSHSVLAMAKHAELSQQPGFAEHLLPGGRAPDEKALLRQPTLGDTFSRLGRRGLDDFYRGELGTAMGEDLARLGSPLRIEDLRSFTARWVKPLSLDIRCGRLWNLPPPTQGVASLMMMGLFDRLAVEGAESFAHVHGLIEATKQAFLMRDRHVTDPRYMHIEPGSLLKAPLLDRLAASINREQALPWPQPSEGGDTVWMGCIDSEGRAVSFIQSTYWEFGAGIVLPSTGVLWQNRGIGFSLDPNDFQALAPGRLPFHTLNPALARLHNGETLVYGTMGGEGQPQTQAAILTRHAFFDQPLAQAVSAPRWLLGRTWGEESATLKMESRFDPALIEHLMRAGHEVEMVGDFNDLMGHAGAVARYADGTLEGGADPRSDGEVSCF